MKKHLLFILLILFTFISCEKDDGADSTSESPETPENPSGNFIDNFGAVQTFNFYGTVIDSNGNAISHALVKVGTQEAYSDVNGIFFLENGETSEEMAFVKASKIGYIDGSTTIFPHSGDSNRVEITLLEKNIVQTVNSGEVSKFELDNGFSIELKGDFIQKNGQAYTGKVDISIHHLPPDDPETFKRMPGSLLARSETNDPVQLETYGMAAVNLYSQNGEELNIAPESSATLEFPVPGLMATNAPSRIPLWYFDEALGYWKKEGEAEFVNGKYIGEVKHFSFWNCDLEFESINLCVTIVDHNNEPIPNKTFILKAEDMNSLGYGTTDMNGVICDRAIKNKTIILKTKQCVPPGGGDEYYEVELGSFSEDAEIEIMVDPAIIKTNVNGKIIRCEDSDDFSSAYIYYKYNGLNVIHYLQDGTFSFEEFYCESAKDATLKIYDYVNNVESEEIQFQFQETETAFGEINLCTTSTIPDENSNVYEGDLILRNPTDLQNFENAGYTKVDGNLQIQDDYENLMNNLNALITLITVEGDFTITSNVQIENLIGLQNLKTIGGDFSIAYNEALKDLTGLERLEAIQGDFIVRRNLILKNLSGLSSLKEIGGSIAFVNNDAALSLKGLQQIQTVNKDLDIVDNLKLESLEGLNNLTTVIGNFSLGSSINYSLTSRNDALTNISALSNLTSTSRLRLSGNPSLKDYSGFQNFEYAEDITLIIGESLDFDFFNNLKEVAVQLYIYSLAEELAGFEKLGKVGTLTIYGGANEDLLKKVSGFNNLISGKIALKNLSNLESVTGFNTIKNVERLDIEYNDKLKSITGFSQLYLIETLLSFQGNPELIDMSGLSEIKSIGSFFTLRNCEKIENLQFLGNLENIGYTFSIYGLDAIKDLSGLEELQQIEGSFEIVNNEALQSLKGLDKLQKVKDAINIKNNSLLEDYCAIVNLFQNGTYGSQATIENNAFNPTVVKLKDGNCKL